MPLQSSAVYTSGVPGECSGQQLLTFLVQLKLLVCMSKVQLSKPDPSLQLLEEVVRCRQWIHLLPHGLVYDDLVVATHPY